MCQTLRLQTKIIPALKIFMGDRHVSKEFQYDLANNEKESQTRKYGSPDLELDQGEGV